MIAADAPWTMEITTRKVEASIVSGEWVSVWIEKWVERGSREVLVCSRLLG